MFELVGTPYSIVLSTVRGSQATVRELTFLLWTKVGYISIFPDVDLTDCVVSLVDSRYLLLIVCE
jgi:hypothetical protein